jgi:hypothetical protein
MVAAVMVASDGGVRSPTTWPERQFRAVCERQLLAARPRRGGGRLQRGGDWPAGALPWPCHVLYFLIFFAFVCRAF